jgi:MFS family permease
MLNRRISAFSYALKTSPVYVAVFLMRFSFAFTVVAIQYIVPIPYERGIISAAYPLMEMLTGLLFGFLADRIGRKWLVSMALFFSTFITLSFTFTRNFELLILIHGLQGICAAAIITCTLASLADLAKEETRGREMGLYDFCTLGGYGLGFVFSLIIIDGIASRAEIPFYVGAAFAMFGAIYSIAFLEDEKISLRRDISLLSTLGTVVSNRKYLSLLATWFVLTVLIGLGLTYTRELFSVIISLKSLGLGRNGGVLFGHPGRVDFLVGALLVVGVILLGFSQTGLGSLADKYGRPRLVFVGEVSIFGIMVTLVLLFQIHRDGFIAIPFLLAFGAGLLAFTPAGLAELADIAPLSGRGSTMGLYSVVVGAGTIFAPLAGGYLISEYGAADGFSIIFAMGIVIMAGVLLSRLLEKQK